MMSSRAVVGAVLLVLSLAACQKTSADIHTNGAAGPPSPSESASPSTQPSDRSSPAPPSTQPQSRPAPPVSRQQATDDARPGGAEIHTANRQQAKLVELADLNAIAAPDAPALPAQDDRAWAVATSGDITTQFGNGEPMRWEVRVIDASTGNVLEVFAGAAQDWPPYFDRLVDQGPPS